MKGLSIFVLLLTLNSCTKEVKEPITNTRDYNSFLINGIRETYNNALSEKVFWSNRLRPDSSGVGDLGPLAGAYTNLFEVTGNVNYLKNVEQLYKKAIKLSFQNKDIYIRSLAHNYISQHRFKEARNILEESYAGISNKHLTELMLFDVYMELGDYLKADEFLGKIKNNNDYNYLIRLAKWSEYKGNLEAAIRYLEKAKKIAESRGSKSLKIWAYINLADFYGHAGKLKKAYNHYLMTLNLQPDNAYAKKGIAWIAFSSEKNTDEAKRILDSIMIHHKVPDYFLFKADIAEYENKILESKKHRQNFINAVNRGNYGAMYNTYLIEIYAEKNPEKALELANEEIENRATPEAYHLLAYAQLKNEKLKEALHTIENFVEGKTFEPLALYHSVLIYKANDMNNKVKTIKNELKTAYFELGPVISIKIENL
ncbi:MAG: hypothetical protein IIB06_03605 [Bacteroidetes bacterium]|nr:hypothetical protein [Bacteroidota bacterium]